MITDLNSFKFPVFVNGTRFANLMVQNTTIMGALIILFSLLIGYVFFMMSFYLLAKVLFPRIQQTPDEDNLLEKIELRKQESARLERANNKSFRFNKQPQVA